MSVLTWILLSCSVGGVLSTLIAAVGLRWVKASWIPNGVSYSVGAMLAAVFLDLIPHGLERASSSEQFLLQVLLGMVFLFILEKLVVWRHDHHVHDHAEEAAGCKHDSHRHSTHSTAWRVLVGDSVHNFIDGVLIAASFVASPALGLNTALAIVAHEIPQELGDAMILVHAGYERSRALFLNLLSGLAMVLGGIAGYVFVGHFEILLLPMLALVSANMLYVTISDLMPGLHRERTRREALIQGALMLLGICTVLSTHILHRS
ncbi:MAG: ZIP family metal transporter [Pseudomonadota bacterium]